MGRKNRRKVEHIKKIHVNKYISKAGQKKKKSAASPTVPPMTTVTSAAFTQADTTAAIPPARLIPKPHRGDIWFANLGSHYGTSVQSGSRPVLIVSNDVANHYSQTITVLPMTTKFKKKSLPTHVMLPSLACLAADQSSVLADSMLLAEQVTTIDKSALLELIGRVTDEKKLKEINKAVAVQLGMTS